MNTNTIVGAVIGLVVLIAGVGFVLNGDSSEDGRNNSGSDTAQASQTSDNNADSSNPPDWLCCDN